MGSICFRSVLVLWPNRGLKGLSCKRRCHCRRGRLIGFETPASLSVVLTFKLQPEVVVRKTEDVLLKLVDDDVGGVRKS